MCQEQLTNVRRRLGGGKAAARMGTLRACIKAKRIEQGRRNRRERSPNCGSAFSSSTTTVAPDAEANLWGSLPSSTQFQPKGEGQRQRHQTRCPCAPVAASGMMASVTRSAGDRGKRKGKKMQTDQKLSLIKCPPPAYKVPAISEEIMKGHPIPCARQAGKSRLRAPHPHAAEASWPEFDHQFFLPSL